MLERRVVIVNGLGLHARAAAKLVRLARAFDSKVTIIREDNGAMADAKSILNILYIAAPVGSFLNILAEGEDEEEALQAVVSLFGSGFGEI